MNYLITLKKDLTDTFDSLEPDKVQLHLVNGELGASGQMVKYIARFILLDCRISTPFDILAFIRGWFDTSGYAVPDINFNCEVIDLESYDLQIDLGLSDKIIITDGKAVVCPPPIWSDGVGTFIAGAIGQAP